MMEEPLISVLIPYYNDKNFLKESIESILSQKYQSFELLLLNHATEDNCRDIAHSYKDNRIKHIDMPHNLGYGGSGLLLQEFLKIAKGKYIKLFCADDIMMHEGLEKLVNYMEKNINIDFAFGNIAYIDKNGKDLKNNWFKEHFNIANKTEIEFIRYYSKGKSMLPYSGSIIKRKILSNITINTTFIMMFDMSLWLELLCAGYKIGFLNEVICKYRIHSGQMVSPKKMMNNIFLSSFEWQSFWRIFQKIHNVEIVKKVFDKDEYINFLNDKKDIPFFVAQAILKEKIACTSIYSYITDLLNDKETRDYLQQKFGYGVKQLRQSVMNGFSRQGFIKRVEIISNLKQLLELNFTFLCFKKFCQFFAFKKKTNK